MISEFWRYLPLVCASLALSPASAQLVDPTNLKVPVDNHNSAAATIAAGNANGQITIVADPVAAGGDLFEVITDNASAIVTLILPGGTEVTATNATNLGFTYATYTNTGNDNTLVPGTFNLAGTHTFFGLAPSQVAGNYKVKINAGAAVTPVLAVVSFYTSSPIRSGVTLNGGTYKTGDTVVITGLAFNGSNPITDATVTARIVNTANVGAVPPEISLVDFGQYDFAASDGLYTGTYTAGAPGKYLAVVRATGSAGGGNYVRTATAAFTVIQPKANFTSFSDSGVDDNANGKPDRIVVNALVNVVQPGSYRVGVTLLASNNQIIKSSTTATLAAGNGTVPVSFRAQDVVSTLGVGGPYTMRDAALVFLDGVENPLVDYKGTAGTTAAYSLPTFDRGSLYLTGTNTVTPIDSNSDGKFDILRVSAGLMVANAGFYSYSARLVNAAGTEIAFFNGSASLAVGANTIDFNFSGSSIGQSCSSGVYSVRSVLIYGGSSSIIQDQLLDTQSFTPAQFANTACFLVSVVPSPANLAVGQEQAYTFSFTDGAGAADLASISFLINSSSLPSGACYASWARADHRIRMYNATGDGAYFYGDDVGAFLFDNNAQCDMTTGTSIVESGNNLTFSVSLKFKTPAVGTKNIYMQAKSLGGADTGLQLLGKVTVSPGSPCDTTLDGSTNLADVTAILGEALGKTAVSHDLNSDGFVNVVDTQKVVNAAMGLGCPAQ